jgi:hypothetical protein
VQPLKTERIELKLSDFFQLKSSLVSRLSGKAQRGYIRREMQPTTSVTSAKRPAPDNEDSQVSIL